MENKTEIKKKSSVLKPRITEKGALAADKSNVYVFNVPKSANKNSIKALVRETYKVTPEGVRVVTVPSKKIFARGKWGHKAGGKKAYVSLKKGDKIEII